MNLVLVIGLVYDICDGCLFVNKVGRKNKKKV